MLVTSFPTRRYHGQKILTIILLLIVTLPCNHIQFWGHSDMQGVCVIGVNFPLCCTFYVESVAKHVLTQVRRCYKEIAHGFDCTVVT